MAVFRQIESDKFSIFLHDLFATARVDIDEKGKTGHDLPRLDHCDPGADLRYWLSQEEVSLRLLSPVDIENTDNKRSSAGSKRYPLIMRKPISKK